jgi:hypothetical protein
VYLSIPTPGGNDADIVSAIIGLPQMAMRCHHDFVTLGSQAEGEEMVAKKQVQVFP